MSGRCSSSAWPQTVGVALILAGVVGPHPSRARDIPVSALEPGKATLENPMVLAEGDAASGPVVWAGDRLFTDPALDLGLARFERHGPPVWDPSSAAWYVWANGAVVRLDGERAVVVLDGVQGSDLDVRGGAGIAVSREPDHAIVLWHLDGHEGPHTLLRGSNYFHPRLSPDGMFVLVHISGANGGRLLVVSPDGTTRDLGPGSDGTFTPDGRGVVFTMVAGDGRRVTAADLYHVDLGSGRRTRLTATADRAEVEPAVSPDGRFVAFSDALTGRRFVARMPEVQSGGGRR